MHIECLVIPSLHIFIGGLACPVQLPTRGLSARGWTLPADRSSGGWAQTAAEGAPRPPANMLGSSCRPVACLPVVGLAADRRPGGWAQTAGR